jgi:hypothetical protein
MRKLPIKKAVHNQDAAAAGDVCDYLRINYKATYDQIYAFVNKVAPISMEDWEALLYESENEPG